MGEFLKWFLRLSPFGIVHNNYKHLWNLFNPNDKKDTIFSDLKKIFNGTYQKSDSISDALSGVFGNEGTSLINKYTDAGPTGRDMWIAGREDMTHQRNVQDMLNAGLNPALMYGSSSAPSINTSSAGGAAGISDFLQLALLPLQVKAMKADIAKTRADTDKTREDTKGQQLSNEWYSRLKEVEIASKRSVIELNSSREREIEQNINESQSRITRNIAETHELEQRTILEVSQMALNQANARRIVELLPYEKLYSEASASSERAAAAAAYASAAYQNGLITHGMIEFVCKKEGAIAEVAAVEAALASPSYDSAEDSTFTKIMRNLVSGVGNAIRLVSPIKTFSSSSSNSNSTVNIIK